MDDLVNREGHQKSRGPNLALRLLSAAAVRCVRSKRAQISRCPARRGGATIRSRVAAGLARKLLVICAKPLLVCAGRGERDGGW